MSMCVGNLIFFLVLFLKFFNFINDLFTLALFLDARVVLLDSPLKIQSSTTSPSLFSIRLGINFTICNKQMD